MQIFTLWSGSDYKVDLDSYVDVGFECVTSPESVL